MKKRLIAVCLSCVLLVGLNPFAGLAAVVLEAEEIELLRGGCPVTAKGPCEDTSDCGAREYPDKEPGDPCGRCSGSGMEKACKGEVDWCMPGAGASCGVWVNGAIVNEDGICVNGEDGEIPCRANWCL